MKRIKFDYTKLRKRIKEVYGTQRKLAEILNISENCMSMKLNNKRYFKISQIKVLIKLLNIDLNEVDSYFFTISETV